MDIITFLSQFNFNVKRAVRLATNFESFAAQHAAVIASGAEVIDIREVPNAQPSFRLNAEGIAHYRATGERLPRRVSEKTQPAEWLEASRVPCVPTTVSSADILAWIKSLDALKAQARLVSFMHKRGQFDETTARKVLGNLRGAIDTLASMDPDAFEYAVRDFDKAHVSSFDDTAALDVFGFHWTASAKGDSTTTRYAEREIRSNNKADQFYAEYNPHALDEDALAGDE